MQVNFFATYRNITGVRSQEIVVEDMDTVQHIVQKVFLIFPNSNLIGVMTKEIFTPIYPLF